MGRVSSFQTLGTLDGPGVRFVVFLQGCPLRCACCHNPETWETGGGNEFSARDIIKKVTAYKKYFGKNGGITVSGGEPLVQAKFVSELFSLCKNEGINTCLDTSGCIMSKDVTELVSFTDYCLLDIKYSNDEDYLKYVGCGISGPLEFLALLDKKGVKTRLRRVIIENKNDSVNDTLFLKKLKLEYPCVEEIELLPFRKLCVEKYRRMNIPFPFEDIPETDSDKIDILNKRL